MPYTIEEHSHRLSAWAASTSARASKLCRFKVEQGVEILEASGFTPALANSNQLPTPAHFDATHAEWRVKVITAAADRGISFTHGIAAKLINCYLKVRFVCAGMHREPCVQALHPPIDAVLLSSLARHNYGGHGSQWNSFYQKRWSKFDSKTYQSVIDLIRTSLPAGHPLWVIEEYWEGHQ